MAQMIFYALAAYAFLVTWLPSAWAILQILFFSAFHVGNDTAK